MTEAIAKDRRRMLKVLACAVLPFVPRRSAAQENDYLAWRAAFRERALAHGIAPDLFARTFAAIPPHANPKVLEHDRRQAEFTKSVWRYLESAVSPVRIRDGRKKAARHADILARIEARFQVENAIPLAIWGLETTYGHSFGGFSVIDALATLAFDGRRRQWAEGQLLAALEIIQDGHVTPENMKGSWAGAMGHTQFIPTSFQSYAVDFTGDGRRDVWSEDPSDALASTANYLARFGWRHGEGWGMEVRLPRGLNLHYADPEIRRSAGFWNEAGLRSATGAPIDSARNGWLFAPAGTRGPGFLLHRNFDVILRYNKALSYALAVCHLADRIEGGAALKGRWPSEDTYLSPEERRDLQRRLIRLGYDTGGVDGIVGTSTQRAVQAFQRHFGMEPDGLVSRELLSHVREASGG